MSRMLIKKPLIIIGLYLAVRFEFFGDNCYSVAMFLALNKKIMWLLVIWFAVLQAISPFIHGHLGGDSPAQGHGLHIHMQAFVQQGDAQHALHSSDLVHTIGVDEALNKHIDLLPSPLFTVLFALFLFAATTGLFSSVFSLHFRCPQYLRMQSRPRAPPFL